MMDVAIWTPWKTKQATKQESINKERAEKEGASVQKKKTAK